MHPSRSSIGAALLGAGLVGLLGALVPFVPGVSHLAEQPTGPAHAGYVAIGLPLVVAGSILLAGSRPPMRPLSLAMASGVPFLVLVAVLVAWGGPLITPGDHAPEVARLLLVAAPAAAVIAPLVVAVAFAPRRAARVRVSRRIELLLLGCIGLSFAVVVGLAIAQQPPFSWDESVYALIARHWVSGTPSTGWGAHRPLVLSLLGVVPALLSQQEWAFRVITLLLGLGTVAAAWFLGRTLGGAVTGLLAAAALAASPALAADAGLFLNDVPATGILLLLTALTWRALARSDERPGNLLLWLAAVAALVSYLRYGSIVSIGAIAIAALAIWPGRLAAARRSILRAAALFLVLLVPHAVLSTVLTGSPVGIVLGAQGGASPDAIGEALLEYLDSLPAPLAGVLPGALMVVGLCGGTARLAAAARRGSWDAGSRAMGLLLIPALVQILVLGLFILPQGRYIFFPVALLTVAGALVVADAVRERGALGRMILGGAGVAIAVGIAVNLLVVPASAAQRITDFGWERDLGRVLRSLGGESCSVLASDVPQIVWYSRCEAYNFGDLQAPPTRDELLTGANRFLVVRSDGRFQPDDADMQAYLSRVDPEPVASVRSARGDLSATVHRFR